jgi:hypothetical protein
MGRADRLHEHASLIEQRNPDNAAQLRFPC